MRSMYLALVTAGVVLATAACDGGRGSGAAAPGGPPASVSTVTDWRNWTRCMREHGIAMPDLDPRTGELVDPTATRPDKGTPAFRDAVRVCAGLEPTDSRSDRNAPLTAAELEQKRKWAECMRAHEVPVPDPDPNDPNGPRFDLMPNRPPTAVIDQALNACNDLLPRR